MPTLQVHEPTQLVFPDEELVNSLIDLYFTYWNFYMPLLHRPTFERQVVTGLHHIDESFGSVVLMVCALGARYSENRRVLMDGTDSWHSAGWKYFCQIQSTRRLIMLRPLKVYDLQVAAVSSLLFCWGNQDFLGSLYSHSCVADWPLSARFSTL